VARHVLSTHLGVATTFGPTSIRLGIQGRVLGSRPTRADGGAPLPAHAIVDARVGIARRIRHTVVEVTASIENLTDRSYHVIEGYPMPPRHGSLSLRLSL
jgi:outer membrane cobalamin receptor